MRVYDSNDFQALIDMLPDSPDAQGIAQILLQMRDENAIDRQPFTFEVDFSSGAGLLAGVFAAPAPGGNVNGSFLVDASSPFMLVSQAFKADLAGVAQLSGTLVVPNWLVSITDQSGNRNWQNAGVPLSSVFGTGQLPYFLPQPRLIPANSNVSINVASFEAATTPNARLSFHGYRLYSGSQK